METNKKRGWVDVLVGLQWGDEGKGKNIDELLLSGEYFGVARFQGGANAGHTLQHGDIKFIGHIIPSGCLQKDIELYIGNGVVVDAVSLIKEIKELQKMDLDPVKKLFISNRAKLVSYMHPFLDLAEEYYRSKGGEKIGTTSRGIGPSYADSRARRGLLIGDALLPDFEQKVRDLADLHMNMLKMYERNYGFEIPTEKIEEMKEKWEEAVVELKNLQICDLSYHINSRLEEGKNILAEGAQGVMLDIDFGDYPNVTSSNTLPANVCMGLGINHRVIRDVYGVIKAYTTKVGGGDFPARIEDEEIEKLFQKAGNEFGATTGRPRMCGWLDLFALNHAIRLSGTNKIFMNKADICPADKIKVVSGYLEGDKLLKEFPFRLSQVTSVTAEEIAGWGEKNHGVSSLASASPELITYLKYIKSKLPEDVKIISVGTGPERKHSFAWDK